MLYVCIIGLPCSSRGVKWSVVVGGGGWGGVVGVEEGDEVVDVDGFVEDVAAGDFELEVAVGVGCGGDEDDGFVLVEEEFCEVVAMHAGEVDVEEGEVEAGFAGEVDSFFGGGVGDGVVSFSGDEALEASAKEGVVFDDEDEFCHGHISCHW